MLADDAFTECETKRTRLKFYSTETAVSMRHGSEPGIATGWTTEES
jgi:hypothetical protein